MSTTLLERKDDTCGVSVDRNGYRGALSGRGVREGITGDKEPAVVAVDDDSTYTQIFIQIEY